MAEEISDDRFKSEMTRMMNTVILKLGEHDKKFDKLEGKADLLSTQMTEIGFKAIEIGK